MRSGTLFLALILASSNIGTSARRPSEPRPDQFVIGRETFFDFGPPFNYYEIFVVQAEGAATSVVRILLTPAADECYSPAKVEVATVRLDQSISSLLGNTNPCAIPEKKLQREIKRCKHCLAFSGANVTMQVRCGEKIRRIRFKVLEQDWFLAHPNTPENTFWTINLLAQLDRALGPGVMEKPAFAYAQFDVAPKISLDPEIQKTLENGGYDEVFPDARDKASNLYRASRAEAVKPLVTLRGVSPEQPETLIMPVYPSDARAGRGFGIVNVSGIIAPDGTPTFLVIESGLPFLRKAVTEAVGQWKFPAEDAGKPMSASFEFSLSCPAKVKDPE